MSEASLPQRIGRYRILAKLGEGGMGAVYAAQDEELGRKVAVKTIRKDRVDPTLRQRMRLEARAAASVNHPNVCQVYESGEDAGELYLAMELLEGESLAAAMARGPLPLPQALKIIIEILAALEALHSQGFVHRDLKPGNIFCTSHGCKLLDFGIVLPPAELLDDASGRLTRTGMLVGTPAFMAPEQWTGQDVGPASDLFAAGAILFELIAGEAAYKGENVLELYNSIVRDPAPSLAGGPAVELVDRIVQRALSKSPEDRPASAAAMARELEAALPIAKENDRVRARHLRRLLIPPLRLLRPDEDIEFLRVSLADALLASLSGREDLVVKAGGVQHAAEDADLALVSRETGVSLMLSGTLLRAGEQIRISAKLLELPEGAVIWSESKLASLADIFSIQDEIAGQIADSLSLRLASGKTGTARVDVPATGKAYEYFLRANQLSYNFGMLAAARDLYIAATEEDPRYAPAWAKLGRVYRVMAKYGHGGPEYLERAEEAFLCALELNPDLALAHNLYAYHEIEELGRPRDAMLRLLEQARRSPTNPDLQAGLVLACRFCGLLDSSVEADRRARRLDPAIATSVSYTYWMRGEYDLALRADDEDLGWVTQYSLSMLGRVDEAIEVCRKSEQRSTSQVERDILVCMRAALEGNASTCVEAVRRLFPSSFHDQEGLYFAGRNALRVGERELGLEILEQVVARGFTCDEMLLRDPWLDPYREDERLKALIKAAQAGREEAARLYEENGGIPLLGPVEGATRA